MTNTIKNMEKLIVEEFFIETSMNGLIIHFMMVHVTIVLEISSPM